LIRLSIADQRLKSSEYAETKSNPSFYNAQRTDQVPYCTDVSPQLHGLNKVETVCAMKYNVGIKFNQPKKISAGKPSKPLTG